VIIAVMKSTIKIIMFAEIGIATGFLIGKLTRITPRQLKKNPIFVARSMI
jgi:hypothetical protein